MGPAAEDILAQLAALAALLLAALLTTTALQEEVPLPARPIQEQEAAHQQQRKHNATAMQDIMILMEIQMEEPAVLWVQETIPLLPMMTDTHVQADIIAAQLQTPHQPGMAPAQQATTALPALNPPVRMCAVLEITALPHLPAQLPVLRSQAHQPQLISPRHPATAMADIMILMAILEAEHALLPGMDITQPH